MGINTSKLTEVGASVGGDLPSGLKFVQWNACSICPKIDQLRFLLDSGGEADILVVTESWLNPTTHTESSVVIDRYHLDRRDRIACQGGGVAAYLHDSAPYHRRCDLESAQLEDL